jgi:hypothetical protein
LLLQDVMFKNLKSANPLIGHRVFNENISQKPVGDIEDIIILRQSNFSDIVFQRGGALSSLNNGSILSYVARPVSKARLEVLSCRFE